MMTYEAWRSSGRLVSLGGREVFVHISGVAEGPALLFFHGFPTTSYDWAGVTERLGDRFRLVAFDFLGFGATAPAPRALDYDQQAELALAVAAHAGLERAVIVAHDYGVSVAQELLARAREGTLPLEIEGVVFLNGGLEPSLHRALFVQRVLAGPLGRWIAPLVVTRGTFARSMRKLLHRSDALDVDEHWSAMTQRGAASRAHELLHYIAERRRRAPRWRAAFADRGTRIGLAWGLEDPVSGAHVLSWARVVRPDADVLALPSAGHYPQLEAPSEVADFIASFAAPIR